jgi:tetratricopeptide (TPR) repeat protein
MEGFIMNKVSHKEARKLIKKNDFADLLENTALYVKSNLENVVIGLVVALIILIAIPLFINYRHSNEEKAEKIISQANYFMNSPVMEGENLTMYGFFRSKAEKFDKAIETYNEIIQKYRGTKAAAAAYLGVADAYYGKGSYKEALEYYNTFLQKYNGNRLYFLGLSGKGYASYQLGNYKDVVEALSNDKALSGAANYYDAKELLADSYLKLNDKQKAKDVLTQIIKDKKGSFWAQQAEEKLKEII